MDSFMNYILEHSKTMELTLRDTTRTVKRQGFKITKTKVFALAAIGGVLFLNYERRAMSDELCDIRKELKEIRGELDSVRRTAHNEK